MKAWLCPSHHSRSRRLFLRDKAAARTPLKDMVRNVRKLKLLVTGMVCVGMGMLVLIAGR